VISERLGGRYEVLGLIAEGGMAHVYRGRRLDDGTLVAIKILRDQYAHNAEFVARFEREAQAVAQLSHPRMVQIFDHGRDGDVHFIVMEYIDGEDLKTHLRRLGPLDEARVREIGAAVCDVLEYAHRAGIVHRDIKPQNILLTPDGDVKVTDFGIARALAATGITETGTVLGSVQYISPEQARGLGAGWHADLYSLGVVLYEAATGMLPFDAETPIAIALRHMHEPPPLPRRDGARLGRDLEGIILKALAKDPDHRYRSAQDMADDLTGRTAHWRAASAAEPTAVVRPGPRRARAGRVSAGDGRGARRSAPLIVAALVLLAAFGGIAWGWQALNAYLNVPEVAVPDFVGRSLVDAEGIARQYHLAVQVVQQVHSPTTPTGSVVSQQPPAGTPVKVNRAIGLVTSIGPEMTTVPDVRRRSLEDTRFAIEQARLAVGEIREDYDDSVPSGFIITQDPAPGASVARDTPVNVTVSKGRQSIVLPDLVGRSLDDARRALQDLGVTLRGVTQMPRSDVPPGQVIAMTPSAGARIAHDAAVGVTIAVRPEDSGGAPPQPIVTGTPPAPSSAATDRRKAQLHIIVPEGPAHQLVRIVVIDQQGVHTVYEGLATPGENVDRQVSGQGYTIVQVYIDNRLIQEIRP
jgi:beta-lactam-binding protein with PASTA domain/tRNA A-37 threonylcarbamoyl transferase component Bud32